MADLRCGIGLELRRYDMASVTREDIDRAPAWSFPADYESDLVMAAEGRYLPKALSKQLFASRKQS